MKKVKTFLVCSRPYTVREWAPGCYGQGPSYEYRDCVYVRCRERSRAKALALRWCRKHGKAWKWEERDLSPFTGMTVERVDTLPKGRLCDCDTGVGPDDNCPRCGGRGWYETEGGGVQHAGPRLSDNETGEPRLPEVSA